jgi:Cu+-exporting ATPase
MENKKSLEEEKTKSIGETTKKRLVVSVTDLSCTTCALAIEKQVMKLKGVSDVRPAVMLNKVFVDYDANLVDSTTIKDAINKTGYKSYVMVEEKRKEKV